MHNFQDALDTLRYGGMMVYPLLVLALLALVIAIDKFYVHWRYARLPAVVVDLVETYGFSWEELDKRLNKMGKGNYFARFFRVIMDNREKPAWWVESRAGDEAQLVQQALNRGLWMLETIVTAAPLLGLLGTIAGMMDAFRLIGASGLVDPTGVTGGVAQALIATAIGLVVAVLALFAYNFFSSLQSNAADELERLGTRLIDHIRLDQQARGVASESP